MSREPVTFTVYVHERGKRPRRVGEVELGRIPTTYEHAGRTFYWLNADTSERTLTYVDIRPSVSVAS